MSVNSVKVFFVLLCSFINEFRGFKISIYLNNCFRHFLFVIFKQAQRKCVLRIRMIILIDFYIYVFSVYCHMLWNLVHTFPNKCFESDFFFFYCLFIYFSGLENVAFRFWKLKETI